VATGGSSMPSSVSRASGPAELDISPAPAA
jgi:hypothetical protein